MTSSRKQATKKDVIDLLKQCYDPELDMDVWTLGLIYDIAIDTKKNALHVTMTLTSPLCPYGHELTSLIETHLYELGFKDVKIDVVFDPPWVPSEEVKEMLGMFAE
jgi:metal-sulfur cluster biosynthetic enzyme